MAGYTGMRGLISAALVVLPALGGPRVVSALDTSTAVIPLDLRQHEFGRELTLLFAVAEASEPCGPADIQINGQPLGTTAALSGRDTVYEDYGSEVVASWILECAEADGDKPAQQSIAVQIQSVDGIDYEDVAFNVQFYQSAPVAILGVDGPLVLASAIDAGEGYDRDFWAQHHSVHGGDLDSEIAAAVSETQFLRLQQREIGDRIRVLEAFIRGSDAECAGRVHCAVRTLFDKMAGMASKAYETVMGPVGANSHGQQPQVRPSRKRPQWRPTFFPCACPTPPAAYPPPGAVDPETTPTAAETPNTKPDVPDHTSPHPDPPTPEIPSGDIDGNNSPKEVQESFPPTDKVDFSAARHSFLTFLVILLIIAAIILIRRAKALATKCHRARTHRHAQGRADTTFLSFFRSFGPRCIRGQADMEQQRPSPEDMRQRTQRSQSDASNTMEQDLAQFRQAVDMFGDMMAAGGDRPTAPPPPPPRPSQPLLSQDLPPAYESEEEGAPMLPPAVSDGLRGVYWPSTHMPGRVGDGSADELGYTR